MVADDCGVGLVLALDKVSANVNVNASIIVNVNVNNEIAGAEEAFEPGARDVVEGCRAGVELVEQGESQPSRPQSERPHFGVFSV